MSWKSFFSIIFLLVVFAMLFFYWFSPFNEISFGISDSGHSNFILNSTIGGEMQFYENMRYRSNEISYKIENCSIGKKDEMKRAFDWIEEKTILTFYEVNENEEISVSCEDNFIKGEKGAFIAGEGGVTNVTLTENFKVIFNGKALLIRETKCPEPLVGTHELLHALGFDHSENPNNIMYHTLNCKQTFGEDIATYINELYSFPSLPDLFFENASASMKGRYLNVEVIIKNSGLKDAKKSKLIIEGNGKVIKEFDIESINIGNGRKITLTNILVATQRLSELEIFLSYDYEELDKNNNKVILEIKK